MRINAFLKNYWWFVIAFVLLVFLVSTVSKEFITTPSCQYSDIFLISSDGDIDTMPGMYTFQDFGDSIVVEDAGENFATFEKGADGTYIFEDVIYALAMGEEDISFIALGHDLRVALVGKTCN